MSTNIESETVPDAAPVAKPGRPARRNLIAAAVGAVLLIGGAGAGYALLGGESAEEASADGVRSAAYVEVPEMIVNLRSSDGRARFLKLRFILLVADAKRSDEIKEKLPVVLDALQPFLRELRPEDLNGSAAVFRVKEEMMVRATSALGAGVVRDVLIQDLIQQ